MELALPYTIFVSHHHLDAVLTKISHASVSSLPANTRWKSMPEPAKAALIRPRGRNSRSAAAPEARNPRSGSLERAPTLGNWPSSATCAMRPSSLNPGLRKACPCAAPPTSASTRCRILSVLCQYLHPDPHSPLTDPHSPLILAPFHPDPQTFRSFNTANPRPLVLEVSSEYPGRDALSFRSALPFPSK